MQKPNPRVVKWLKQYRSNLDIEYNPLCVKTIDDGEGNKITYIEKDRMWVVTQTVSMWQDCPEIDMLILQNTKYPVLWVDQAQEIDWRWIQELEEARFENRKDFIKKFKEREHQKLIDYRNTAEDWARDVGWWHFKKAFDQFNLSNYKKKDPTRKFKELRQKLGRELK